ncbi:NAD(P)-dependent dehydrogenase, short-chain alcohol dehydrogenase family [Paenibacillus sp. UNC496MF]|uniref:SDR family oxidoreductase n=1 Tax=Paenibacillus sp. UNC496MF TaxID=1502753 RepID=UPI0008EBDB85|nr:SDR family oxidoreductase [Paenibacillus sp. UNC496MF]SFI50472.1 NAD(P)-dependent dehydrogenase, short-chain alcohol dehydrogenase family [Paenibacillus sp. UNC496MF]
MNRLEGKIAVVTGASRGIGRAVALRLAKEGALTAVHYGRNRERAEAVVREIEQEGGSAFAIGAELRSAEGALRLCEAMDKALAARTDDVRFDILVNNAGIGLPAAIGDTTEAAFDELMAVNAKAPFFLIRQALPRLRNGGRIVNLSSAVTRISLPAVPAYSMTKGAVNALTLALANQLAPRGITINAVQPGFVATDMNAGMLQDPEAERFGAGYAAFGRWGQPEDVADVVAFLASPDSRWVTGQLIDASGGSHL